MREELQRWGAWWRSQLGRRNEAPVGTAKWGLGFLYFAVIGWLPMLFVRRYGLLEVFLWYVGVMVVLTPIVSYLTFRWVTRHDHGGGASSA